MADRVEELLSEGGACCLAFTPKINVWNGRESVDLVVEDFQAGGRARLG
jgi:single-stranded-DNA-specific exonuclease